MPQLIEESEERLTEEQIEQLLDVISKSLPGDDDQEEQGEDNMEAEEGAGEWWGCNITMATSIAMKKCLRVGCAKRSSEGCKPRVEQL